MFYFNALLQFRYGDWLVSGIKFLTLYSHNMHISLQQRVATILWSLWKHRNLKLWQNEQQLSVHMVESKEHNGGMVSCAYTPPTDTKLHHGPAIGNPTHL